MPDEPNSAPPPLIVSIPHRLGREEAKRRLDAGIGRLGAELGAIVGRLDYGWDADTLNFRAAAMWQTITGRVEVLDDLVRIEIDLPWMMRLLADTITHRVRGRAAAMLEKPPGEG
jgi:Putative polyhydroxyalkanoic acid system protein (PHA_gran_rgn)